MNPLVKFLLAHRGRPRLLEVASAPHRRVAPRVLDQLAEITREERERDAAKLAAQAREVAPYGVDERGRILIYDAMKEPAG